MELAPVTMAAPAASRPFPMLNQLQDKLGYHFRDKALLETALTHSSWINEQHSRLHHNERLEFLGDAVLELCISEELYARFPSEREGELTRMRSRLVSKPALAERAHMLHMECCLRLGKGEEHQGGRSRSSLLSDAFEAMLGAVFLDGGYSAARQVVGTLFADHWPALAKTPLLKDCKSLLQEMTQKQYGTRPVYALIESSGPEHEKIFTVRVTLSDDNAFTANGPSMKRAEQNAALLAIESLTNSSPDSPNSQSASD